MTGFIVSVFPFRNRVSANEAFEGLELGEGKPSRPVLRGLGDRKAAWLLGNYCELATATSRPSRVANRTFICPPNRMETEIFSPVAGVVAVAVTLGPWPSGEGPYAKGR